MDERYRSKYSLGLIENLDNIRDTGLDSFIETENARRICPRCGKAMCVHDRQGHSCD